MTRKKEVASVFNELHTKFIFNFALKTCSLKLKSILQASGMNPTLHCALILVLNWEEHLNLLTNIWLKSTWMNASNNDDIGGLEFRLLCVKSPYFPANCDGYFSFQKILILKILLQSFLF